MTQCGIHQPASGRDQFSWSGFFSPGIIIHITLAEHGGKRRGYSENYTIRSARVREGDPGKYHQAYV